MNIPDLRKSVEKAESLYNLAKVRNGLVCALAGVSQMPCSFKQTLCLALKEGIDNASIDALTAFAYARIKTIDEALAREGVIIEGPEADVPGPLFSNKEATIPAAQAATVAYAARVLKSDSGTWKLKEDGKFVMAVSEEEADKPYAIIDGVTYVSEEELKKHHVFNIGTNAADLGTRVDSLASQVLMLADKLKVTTPSDGYEFNNPQDLPPVGCELLIKVPAGTDVTTLESQKSGVIMGYTTEAEAVFKAFRTKHLANRSGEMEYRLPDDSTVTGRFPWTYP